MRLVDADALDFKFDRRCFSEEDENYVRGVDEAIGVVENAPTIDPVHAAGACYCRECILHGDCLTEDTFHIARIENPFCCGGKLKEEK